MKVVYEREIRKLLDIFESIVKIILELGYGEALGTVLWSYSFEGYETVERLTEAIEKLEEENPEGCVWTESGVNLVCYEIEETENGAKFHFNLEDPDNNDIEFYRIPTLFKRFLEKLEGLGFPTDHIYYTAIEVPREQITITIVGPETKPSNNVEFKIRIHDWNEIGDQIEGAKAMRIKTLRVTLH